MMYPEELYFSLSLLEECWLDKSLAPRY